MRDYRAPGSGVGGVLYSLTTSTGMVAVINALLGGVLAGVLALLVGAGGVAAGVIGVVGAALSSPPSLPVPRGSSFATSPASR